MQQLGRVRILLLFVFMLVLELELVLVSRFGLCGWDSVRVPVGSVSACSRADSFECHRALQEEVQSTWMTYNKYRMFTSMKTRVLLDVRYNCYLRVQEAVALSHAVFPPSE